VEPTRGDNMSVSKLSTQKLLATGVFALTFANAALYAQASSSPSSLPSSETVSHSHGVTVLNVHETGTKVDFAHAKELPMPVNPFVMDSTQALLQALRAAPSQAESGFSPGSAGTGTAIAKPTFLGVPESAPESSGVTSEDFGTNNHPFTTARGDLFTETTNLTYPYRAAGKLFFNEPGGTYICSASLIKRGIVVTAAHCVANYGAKQFYSNWQFVPAYRNGSAPFGVWNVRQAWVLTAYYNGTDGCAVYGVVCPDDVAVLILNTQNNSYAGSSVGWLGYWYGGGYTSNGLIEVTQLGYPVGLDRALYMERNDSYGYISAANSNDVVIGSNMNGGSSGGPWIVNFGLPYALSGETNGSGYSFTNAVVAVTSWGYMATGPKEQGASQFTAGNIQLLLNSACASTPAACS
jgi:V8-like Glu-specific endopeptidase